MTKKHLIEVDEVPQAVCDALRQAKRVAIAGHVTPDADCIGAIAGLCLALPELGITPFAILPPESVARRMDYLVEHSGIKAATLDEIQSCDAIIAVDTAKEPRLNIESGVDTIAGIPVINIDHHATNKEYGQVNWISGHRSSTCEMVYEVLRALGCQVTPTIATLLFSGIHTDTQGFSLSNTTPRSFQVGYELALAGADVHSVGERMHRSMSKSEFDLMKVIYGNTHVTADGRIAWSTASHEEIVFAGCNANDIDNQVEVPRAIEGIDIAMLFSEGNPGKVRVNFRGEQGLSILALAKQFSGGGHHASAGAIIDGNIEDVSEKVVEAAKIYLNQQTPKE